MPQSSLDELRFTVPGEPQGKGRARVGNIAGRARMFTPAKTVQYENLIALMAQDAMGGADQFAGPVLIEVTMHCAVRASWSKKKQAQALAGEMYPTSKPDADNCLKAVCDALNGVAWKDDTQVTDVRMRKRFSETPRVEVIITPLAKLASN